MNISVNSISKRLARFSLIAPALVGFLFLPCLTTFADDETDKKLTYDDHIGPLLNRRCSSCHNSNKKSGNLNVTSLSSLMEGGGSGSGIEPGDSGGSYLVSLVNYEDSPNMPPTGKLPDEEIQLIQKWIDGGALENKGSQAKIKTGFDVAMALSPTIRPDVLPFPARLPLEPVLRTKRAAAVTAMATSPWAPIVAITSPRQVLLYNTQSLELVGVLPMEGQANSLCFSRSGRVLIAGGGTNGAKGSVMLWNIPAGQQIAQIGAELDAVLAADISPDQSMIALGGPGKRVKVFSSADGSLLYEIKKHTDWVTAIEFSPDGKYLASGDRNGGVRLWFAEDGSEHLTLGAHTKMISGLSWRIDSRMIATASEDTSIRIWEVENGKQIKLWNSHKPGITSIKYARDGSIVTCGRDNIVRKWTQDGMQIQQYEGLTDVAVSVTYCDETRRVLAGDWTGAVRIWNDADALHVGNLDPNPPTLRERLTAAQAKVLENRQAFNPLAQLVAELESQLGQLSGSLQQEQEQLQTAKSKVANLEKQLVTTRAQLDSTFAEQMQWRNELSQKTDARPLIEAAFNSALEAAKSLPNDAEMQDTADRLGEKVKNIVARLEELTNLDSQTDRKKAETELQAQQLIPALATANQQVQDATSSVSQLQSQMGAITDQLVKQRELVMSAEERVKLSLVNAIKWQGEIEFVAQLKSIEKELDEARKLYAVKEGAAQNAADKLAEVEAETTFTRNERSEANKKVEELLQKMQRLKRVQK